MSRVDGIPRRVVQGLALVLALASSGAAFAQAKVRFALDWRIDGQLAPFFMAQAKGYFKQEGLEVQLDPGAGSALAVSRTASPAYDLGYGDTSALIEFLANNGHNPDARVQAVYMVMEATPAAAMTLRKSNINKPADFAGKTFAAPVFDAGRKLFPLFARAQGFDPTIVKWQSVEPALRETMLARGQVDVVTGYQPSGILSMHALGVKEDELRIFYYKDHGVRAYGNAILANPKFAAEQPQTIAAFLRAFNRAIKETIADYESAVKFVKQREPLIDEALELRRLRGLYENFIATPAVRSGALGEVEKARLDAMVEDVVRAFGLKQSPKVEQIFNASFLPNRADRRLQ
jgi:NitT/TauT family transport system substrate-binding protein